MKNIITIILISLCTLAMAQETLLEDNTSFYPRMIRLNASGEANGRIIASFDLIGAGRIYQSTDDGVSWSPIATITETQYQNTCCSELYEVPQTLGSTTAGTLFWAVSVNNGAAPASRAIKIYKSTDQGNTWSYFSTPVTGNTGLWEAEFMIDDLGRMLMYYATEEHKGAGYNQLIAHKISTDGGATWGSELYDIAIGGGVQRPGMPTVTQVPNGDYIMVYEICGSSNCDTFYRSSSNGYSWGTLSSLGTRIESVSGNHFSHAPTVTWVDNGTTNGELVVAGQVLRDNGTNAVDPRNGQIYMVNSTNGSGLWAERATPIFTPSDGTNPCTNYSTQFLSRSSGTEIIQLANKDCKVYAGIAKFNAPIADGVYRLTAQHSSKVLDVSGCSTADGANVHQWPWVGGDCQRWKFEYLGNNEYKITSQVSGKALEIQGCATANGGNVRQWPWNGADCQRWYVEEVGDGYFRLISKNSGRALDVDGCSTTDGANVQQWDWIGGGCQRWKIEAVSPNEVSTGTFRLLSKNSGQALDVNACATSAGANVQQWPWNGATCQQWSIQAQSDGYYKIFSVGSGHALDVEECQTTNGANVRQWTSNSADCQRWGFEEIETGYYRIISKYGGKVLDIAGCATTNGANAQIWQWNGADCQLWEIGSPTGARMTGVLSLEEEHIVSFSVFPNPTQDKITLNYQSLEDQTAMIKISNTLGQVMYDEETLIHAGINEIGIETGEYAEGIYLLSFKVGQKVEITKIRIQ